MRGVKTWTESAIHKRTKAGLGVGMGCDYKPAIRVQDFSSKAPQTRMPMLGHTVHAHSGLERALLLVKEFECNVVEYRDQFPMDRSITLGLAEHLGVAHPRYPKTKVPVVMTFDAVVSERRANGGLLTTAYDVKPHSHLSDERVQEKLRIHQSYCAYLGIEHCVYTERSTTGAYVKNIDRVRAAGPKPLEVLPVPDLFTRHPGVMVRELMSAPRAPSILAYCQSYDRRHALPTGNGVRLFKHLLWTHCARIDLTKEVMLAQPLPAATELSLVDRHGVCLA